ncbi:oxygenase [Nocardiopsis sp. N85]|uniref:styrene monooxygenase/indole monooxygenase family protein n=1 Tax=Nocardiopsis sp. N85 TaxID=3029400 RepID=UPI00237F0C1A|nr:styrene monooxygenase/indole monooxygenase family protein [Nocardiopsis sp. N85]MDE3719847.1 oxygenase [Nocardiopsis sp. N85]
MRKILIVGAGHAGLHLAHGLLTQGYDVTVITGQSSLEIRTGRPSISQFTFPTALEYERKFDLDFWSALSPQIREQKLAVFREGKPVTAIRGRSHPGNGYTVAVDRRVKMADWLEFFEDRGGKVVIHGVTVTDLDYFSRMFELIIVAVGHGELGQLFDHDTSRFSGTRPRALAQAYVYDLWPPSPGESENIGWFGVTEEAGNIMLVPILTQEGPAHNLLLVDKKGGPMDAWPDRPGPEEQLRRMKDLMRKYAPEFFERSKDAVLVDGRSTIVEDLTPQVRNPVGRLPSGGLAIGMADVVVTMDPFVGQSWNNSTRCAQAYLEGIVEHGDKPFDEDFMVRVFDRFWEFGQDNQAWAEFASTMVEQSLPDHIMNMLGAAVQYEEVADRWIQGWDSPSDYKTWMFDPEIAQRYISEVQARNGG